MLSQKYFSFIQSLQQSLLVESVAMLVLLPIVFAFFPDIFPDAWYSLLYRISLASVFLVMVIRPLADLFPRVSWLRPLVILRKGFGVLSASIIVSFILSKIMVDGWSYFTAYATPEYWAFTKYFLFAHVGDVSAVLLLITSNKFSKRVMGPWWKRLQKLAYVYFYAGAFYEASAFNETLPLIYMSTVTVLVLSAYIKNRSFSLQTQTT